MSSNKTIKSVIFILLGLGVGFGLVRLLYFSSNAESGGGKWLSLNPSATDIRHTAKLSLPVEATFEVPEENVEPNVPFHIIVHLNRNLLNENYSYELALPNGIHLTASSTAAASGSVPFADGAVETNLTFELEQTSAQNKHVHFRLFPNGDQQHIKDFSLSTLRFHEVQSKNDELMKRQEEYLKLNPEVLKIQK